MTEKSLGKFAFVATTKETGIVEVDAWSARNVFRDLGWERDYKVFEAMEAKKTVVFHLDDHLERLIASMLSASLPFSFDSRLKNKDFLSFNDFSPENFQKNKDIFKEFLEKAVIKTLKANAFNASLVRIFLTGGWTDDGFHPSSPPNLYILNAPFKRLELKDGNGLRLKTVNYYRPFPLVKNTDYFAAEIALPRIAEADYNDILYSSQKREGNRHVFETSTANFFLVAKGEIFTPKKNILLGVTRRIVLDLAQAAGLNINRQWISFEDDVVSADEAFITNTSKGVWPVVKVDNKNFPVGPVTLKLREFFEDYRKKYYEQRLGNYRKTLNEIKKLIKTYQKAKELKKKMPKKRD